MVRKERGIILGAGLAGLGAAVETGFTIYEKRSTPGGTADSIRRAGFVFDQGIHVLQSKDVSFLEIMDRLGVGFSHHKRNAWIYSNGQYAAYPFQVNTSNLPWPERIRCIAGYLARNTKDSPRDYAEWITENFGKGFAEIFLVPYSEKFWGVSPREMTYEWCGQRVPRPRSLDVVRGAFRNQDTGLGTNPTFAYPSERGRGFAAIAEAFVPKVREIRYGMTATALDAVNRVVGFNNGEASVAFDAMITTIPLPELVGLLRSAPPEVVAASADLRCNSIAVVNLGIKGQNRKTWHWAHYPGKDISFFRISFPHMFGEDLTPPGTYSIQAEVSYGRNAPPERDALIHAVRSDLVRVGLIDAGAPTVYSDVTYLQYGYVVYDRRRADAAKRLHEYFNKHGVFPCGRYGAWEYLWSDEAVMSGVGAARTVRSYLSGIPEHADGPTVDVPACARGRRTFDRACKTGNIPGEGR